MTNRSPTGAKEQQDVNQSRMAEILAAQAARNVLKPAKTSLISPQKPNEKGLAPTVRPFPN